VSFVTKEVHIQFVENLKNKVKMVIEFLTLKVQSHFLSHGVTEALRVVILQY
jgi:hypothetical protein